MRKSIKDRKEEIHIYDLALLLLCISLTRKPEKILDVYACRERLNYTFTSSEMVWKMFLITSCTTHILESTEELFKHNSITNLMKPRDM